MKKKGAQTSRLVVEAIVLVFVLFSVGNSNQLLAQADRTIVAVVNGKAITQQEVDNAAFSQIFPLQEQLYALRKVELDNLILRTLLEDESKKRGIPIEDLEKQLLFGKKIEVSASEVEREYLQNLSAFGSMSPAEAKQRIRLSIESQERIEAYLKGLNNLRKSARLEIRLSAPRLHLTRELGGSPAIGPEDAPVMIIEFTDFECPFCRESNDMIKKILEEHRQEVRLVFKHLPLDNHRHAFEASRAAFCAGQQDSFWRYSYALFASRDLSAEGLSKTASGLGLEISKFKDCLTSDVSQAAILRDISEAKRLGIHSTPTFIVNGRFVRGSIAFDEFKSIIADELKRAGAEAHSNVTSPRKDQQ